MKVAIYVLVVGLVVGIVSSKGLSREGGLNDRPIIGIFTQPSSTTLAKFGSQFIAASYVKHVESAGARVVPIRYTLSAADLQNLLNSVNGVLLPGGGVDFGTQHQYWATLTSIYNYVVEANKRGDFFPLWGTCMGFQEICIQQSQNMNLLTATDSENYTIPLNFTSLAPTSRMFGTTPANIIDTLAREPVTMNNHHWGVTPADFSASQYLSTFFNVLSTNVDRKGKKFVSTIEGKNSPVYASQWHPEKPQFEWNINEVINHSPASILANQYMSNFFVGEARKCNHSFSGIQQEAASLIYNYQPVFIYNYENDFEQGYFFQ